MTLVQKVVLSLPKPHCKKQRLLMHAFQIPGIREIWVAAGTKFGKSIALSVGAANSLVSRERALWRWTAPIYDQADIGMQYVRRMLPNDDNIVNVNKGSMRIHVPPIDATMKFAHAQDPTSLEGFGVSGDIFDECAKIKREAYDSAKTTRSVTGGPFVGASTPLGKNWFYVKCMEAKDEMDWAMRSGKQPTRIFITAPSTDNPFVSKEAVAEARRDMPDRLFRQYYLAEFIDDGGVFSNFRRCIFGEELELYGDVQRWIAPEAEEKNVVLGVDWAKTIDWTVFWAIDFEAKPPRVVGFERFHRKPYTEAVKRLGWFGKEFASVAGGYHDKTGVGAAIDEMCHHLPFALEGIVFTNPGKVDLVNRAITRFELRDIGIPWIPQAVRELDAFEVKINAIGTMSYSAPTGQHDDCVMALCLGIAALAEYSGSGEIMTLEDDDSRDRDDKDPKAPEEKTAIEQFYADLAEDAEDD